jgi:hypothetical protein
MRQKRGGEQVSVPLENVEEWLTDSQAEEVLKIDMAMDRLREMDPRAAEVVEMRFFGGLSVEETGEALGVSGKTVQPYGSRLAPGFVRKSVQKSSRKAPVPFRGGAHGRIMDPFAGYVCRGAGTARRGKGKISGAAAWRFTRAAARGTGNAGCARGRLGASA